MRKKMLGTYVYFLLIFVKMFAFQIDPNSLKPKYFLRLPNKFNFLSHAIKAEIHMQRIPIIMGTARKHNSSSSLRIIRGHIWR